MLTGEFCFNDPYKFTLHGFSVIRKDGYGGCGGLQTLVRQNIYSSGPEKRIPHETSFGSQCVCVSL